jgi:hypothetical protein
MASIGTVAPSPGVLAFADRPELAEVVEALLCMSSGNFATRACSETDSATDRCNDVVRVGGVRMAEPRGTWVRGRSWLPTIDGAVGRSWRLDTARGVVEHDLTVNGRRLTTTRFASAAMPGVAVWTMPSSEVMGPGPGPGDDDIVLEGVSRTAVVATRTRREDGAPLRIAAAGVGPDRGSAAAQAARAADTAAETGISALLRAHEVAWADIWENARIDIDGCAADDQAVDFAMFHLLSLANGADELGIGARGLTGDAYDGHVFWDADVFVLPVLAATRPEAAAAMLAYRANRLGAAFEAARREGRRGARFPWESAESGFDVTPRSATALDGAEVAITTGDKEIHISSDIAWAVLHHARWTGDTSFLDGPGRPLVIETARYLADRIDIGDHGRGHLRDVTGPDEYHEGVDDNAFTNGMARWHLRAAAGLLGDGAEAAELECLAGILVDGFDPRTGRHEQFAGFSALDPLVIAAVAMPPVAADVVLGRDVVRRSQVLKQADAVMLHHLIGDDLPSGSLLADLDFSYPRTAHGSSLSPAIHASALARVGRSEDALAMLRLALQMDLEDRTGTTADGLHFATMGGAWQAIVFGFLGLAVEVGARVRVDPALPSAWQGLRVRCRALGRRIEISAGDDEVVVLADGPVAWTWPGAPAPVATDAIRLVGGRNRWRQA